jgi:hypothetical protein
MRRIKSVSLTIPCVTGPYASVSCTLTLLNHQLRRTSDASEDAETSFGFVQSIATSGGRNDAGMFELNFRDERRLPFEGAGAISRWRLELPVEVRQFDYDTISDIIFHISYTALEGGGSFKADRQLQLTETLNELVGALGNNGLIRAFSLRHEFSNEWHRLRKGEEVSLTIDRQRLPYFASVLDPDIKGAMLLVKVSKEPSPAALYVDGALVDLAPDEIPNLQRGVATVMLDVPFTLKATDPADLEALLLIVTYQVKKPQP